MKREIGETFNIENQTEIEKPQILYHGSANSDIQEFEPRDETVRDSTEGKVVFAGKERAQAAMSIVPVDDSWCRMGYYDGQPTIIISDQERFEKLDKGGAIYEISSDNFESDIEKDPKQREWTSKSPVKPISKTKYKTGREAMEENGVRIIFTDKETFEKIAEDKDGGYEIIMNLRIIS